MDTYRAIELSGPGKFSEVRKPLLDPGPNRVRIRVEACGVCHSDSATVEERKVAGSLTGNPATGDATLRFSALSGVSPMIETVPLDQAAAAYAKMMAGKARFRMVLIMKNGGGQIASRQ